MSRLKGRLDKLEKTVVPEKTPPLLMRAIITSPRERTEISTCTRTLKNGILTEIVHLEGNDRFLTDDEVQKFINGFPIWENS